MHLLQEMTRWLLRFLHLLFWKPFFPWFRGLFLLLALLNLQLVLESVLFRAPEKSDLLVVAGTYRLPRVFGVGGGNESTYGATIETADGTIKKCDCSTGATGRANCLIDQSVENLEALRALKDKPVTVLMSRKAIHEYRHRCYEIRAGDVKLLTYEKSRERYLQRTEAFHLCLLPAAMAVGFLAVYVATFTRRRSVGLRAD